MHYYNNIIIISGLLHCLKVVFHQPRSIKPLHQSWGLNGEITFASIRTSTMLILLYQTHNYGKSSVGSSAHGFMQTLVED